MTRGDLDGQQTRWRKARRLDGATLLRLLEPRAPRRGHCSDRAPKASEFQGRILELFRGLA